MKAYMLIDIQTGEIKQVIQQLRRVEGVKDAHMTFGPHDAIAMIEAEGVSEIGRIMAEQIQPIPGVQETLTCLAVDD